MGVDETAMNHSSAEWEQLLAAREVVLPNPMLALAVAFLEHHRTPQGWGVFPGAAFHRHTSAVVVEALHDLDSDISGHFTTKYQSQVRGLGSDALADVVHLLAPSLNRDAAEWRALKARAALLAAELMRDIPPDACRQLAAIMLAFANFGQDDLEVRDSVCGFLIQQQQSAGNWSTMPGDGGSTTATGETIRALALYDRDDARQARDVAAKFVRERATAAIRRGNEADTFELATLLRALATYQDAPYQMVSDLEVELARRQDGEDGGLPSAPGRDSSIELTALTVLAMDEAGARKHVPARLAWAAMADLGGRLNEGEHSDRTSQVRDDSKRRLESDLRKSREAAAEVPKLKRELRMLTRVTDPLNYERELLSSGFSERTSLVAAAIVTLGAVAAAILTSIVHESTASIVAAAIFGTATVVAGFLMLSTVRVRSRALRGASKFEESTRRLWAQELGPDDETPVDGRVSDLRRGLQFIVEDWPPSTREELRYLLYESFLGVPSDVAARRAEKVAVDLGVSARDAAQFSSWASAVGTMPDAERRVLFDQLRRMLL
jgi:hypothetical protein